MREKARLKKALTRQREAEEHMLWVFRVAEERNGAPVVLFDAYADAVERYKLEGWRPGEDRHTAGETIARGRELYQQMIEAMTAYTTEGGRDRWGLFEAAVYSFVGFAAVAVEVAQGALHSSDVGFSEFTDPAFAELVDSGE